MQYKVLEKCGAALDWGEQCGCEKERREQEAQEWQRKNEARKELAACKISA